MDWIFGIMVCIGILVILILLYLLALMPRVVGRPNFNGFRGWHFAHRGLHDNQTDAPENSLAAFRKAVEQGYGMELDIQLTKDNVPVVMHDYRLTRVCGEALRVSSLTLAELRSKKLFHSNELIPTLEEVLEVVKGKVPLIIEFKVEALNLALCRTAAPILDKYQGAYCMESFNPLCVRWFKKHRRSVIRGQLSTNFIHDKEKGNRVLLWILQNMLLNFLGKPDFVAYNYQHSRMLSFQICRRLYHLPTFAWTVRTKEAFEEAKAQFDFFIFDSFILDK